MMPSLRLALATPLLWGRWETETVHLQALVCDLTDRYDIDESWRF